MSKDAATLYDTTTVQVDDTAQPTMDSFGNVHMAPVRKLDADEYTANDLDGVTETATGSGNLNFLMMQAGQTNEAMGNQDAFNVAASDFAYGGNAYGGGAAGGAAISGTDNGFDTAMDRGFDGGRDFEGQGQGNLNNIGSSSAAAGSLSASNLAANTATANPLSSVTNFASFSSTATAAPPLGPINGNNGVDGTNGNNGTNGDGTGTTIINNTTVINETFLENVENIVNQTTTNLGDILNTTTTNLGDVINNTTTNVFDTVDNTVTNLGDVINNTTTNLGDVINTTTTNLFDTVNTVTNNVTDIINNIINNGSDFHLGPIGLNLDLLLDNITNINLDIINGQTITNVLNQTIDTAPILAPVQTIIGDLLSHTSLDVLINPFQPDTSAGDTDLHVGTNLDVLGIHIPDIGIDIPLDIAEGLLGDIDIGLDLTNDILGGVPVLGDLLGGGTGNGDTDLALGGLGGILNAPQLNGAVETLLNPVENLVGDIDIGGAVGLDLLGLNSGQTGPDSDITIPLDLDLAGADLLNDGIDINIDPLEAIVGDIDLDLGVAGNVLGDIADPLFDHAHGGNGQNDLLAQLGDGLSGLVGEILPVGNGADTDVSLNTGVDLLDHALAGNGLGLVLNPVEDVIGDLDIGGAIGLDLLGNAQAGGTDTDITLPLDFYVDDNPLLQDGLSIPLDPIEQIVGDIDINLGAAGNILGSAAPGLFDNGQGGSGSNGPLPQLGQGLSDLVGAVLPIGQNPDTDLALGTGIDVLDHTAIDNGLGLVLNPLEDVAGDIDLGGAIGLDLLGNAQGGADTDITVPLDTHLVDNPLLDNGLAISLDPLEQITGDIDINLAAAGDVLGHAAPGLVDAVEGGSHGNGLLTQIGDGLSGIAGDLLPQPQAGDSDITVGTGIDIGGHDLLQDAGALVLDPIENVTGDIDLGASIGGDLLGNGGHAAGDTDLTIDTGIIAPVHVNLDLVETVTGDLDLGVDLHSAVGDTIGSALSGAIDPLSPAITETVNNLNIFTQSADTGLHMVLDTVTGGTDTALAWAVPGIHETIGNVDNILSPVADNAETVLAEAGTNLGSLLAPLESTIDSAIGILNSSTPSTGGLDLGVITGGLAGGGSDPVGTITAWTETVLPNAGDLLGGGLHSDPITTIPDPVLTAPVLTLPAIPAVPAVGGALGGLLGGHHGHGGLFG